MKIKELRKSKGLSQEGLAKVMNVSQSAIGSWEVGSRKPKYSQLFKLARVLEVDVQELLSEYEKEVI